MVSARDVFVQLYDEPASNFCRTAFINKGSPERD